MQNDHHTETESEREARWQRVLAMTDAENEANIASDPDSQVPSDAAFLARGRWVLPGTDSIVLPLVLDAKTAHWLDEHHVDYQLFLSSVIKAYVESQKHVQD